MIYGIPSKKTNLQIIGIPNWEKRNGPKTVKEIMVGNFSKLGTYSKDQVHEEHRSPHKINIKRSSPRHNLRKLTKF